MNKTNRDKLEDRFQSGDDVFQCFEISAVFKLSALAREAGIIPRALDVGYLAPE